MDKSILKLVDYLPPFDAKKNKQKEQTEYSWNKKKIYLNSENLIIEDGNKLFCHMTAKSIYLDNFVINTNKKYYLNEIVLEVKFYDHNSVICIDYIYEEELKFHIQLYSNGYLLYGHEGREFIFDF